LLDLYGTLENVDIWIAGLLEDLVPGARVGPTFQCLLLEQFDKFRHGDRFWFENEQLFRKMDKNNHNFIQKKRSPENQNFGKKF